MKYILFKTTLILVLLSNIVFSQEKRFKEVKTAQDVIDNNMDANGGKENLMKIKSISITASASSEGGDYPFKMHIGSKIFYMNFTSPVFSFSLAYDGKNKKGWSKFGDKVTEMKKEQLDKYQQTVEASLWKYYYDREKYGISYELLENEKVDDKESYVVDFKKGEKVIYTVYFDTANYNRLKQVSENTTTTYGDFKEVNGTGIIMPYSIITQQSTLKASKIEFNKKFDSELLEEPK